MTVPAGVQETIKKIVTLLSQALVLALGLMKAMMVAPDNSRFRRIEDHDEHSITTRMEPAGAMSGDSSAAEYVRVSGRNGNRYEDLWLPPTHAWFLNLYIPHRTTISWRIPPDSHHW